MTLAIKKRISQMDLQQRLTLKTELLNGLRMHTGSECVFRHWTGTFVYTEGVAWLAEKAKAYWLIDLIGSYRNHQKIKNEDFVFWKLTVKPDQTAIAVAGDGNGNDLVHQDIEYTDFPLDGINFYFTNKTLLLPSEY